MKKIIIFIFIISGLAIFSSCLTMRRNLPVSQLHTQINLTMDNLIFLGEITGTATQSYVIGIPYGGRKYKTASLVSANSVVPFHMGKLLNRGYNNALYDALMSKPEADFVLPITVNVETKHMFLGRMETTTIKGKAFKIKIN